MYNLSSDEKAVQRWIEGVASGEAIEPPHNSPGPTLTAILRLWRELGGKQGPHDRHSLRALEKASSVKSVHAKAHARVVISRDEAEALLSAMLRSWTYEAKLKRSVPIETKKNADIEKISSDMIDGIFGDEQEVRINIEKNEKSDSLDQFLEQRISNSDSVIFGHADQIIIENDDFDTKLPYFHRFYWFTRPFATQEINKNKCVLILVVDIGDCEPTEAHFNYFSNTATLATHVRSLAYFDWDDITEADIIDKKGESKDTLEMLKSISSIRKSGEQGGFWKGINENVCVVVKGWNNYVRRLDGLFHDENSSSQNDEYEGNASDDLRRIFGSVSSEHFLPREIPRPWEGQPEVRLMPHEHSFRLMASLEKSDRQVKFFSLVSPPRAKLSKTSRRKDQVSQSLGIQEIRRSPGKSYERAVEIMTLAAKFRLGLLNSGDELVGQNAVALLAAHGFSTLRVADFIRARRSSQPPVKNTGT